MKQKTLSSLLFLILGYTIGCQAEPAPEIASSKAAPAALQNADQLYTPHDFRQITSMTSKILDRNHYSELVMSRELSARIFDRFFDSLDPQHTFFTQQDMAKFTAKRETLGWDLQKGEYQLAFDVYDVYKKRYAEYRAFTEKCSNRKSISPWMNFCSSTFPKNPVRLMIKLSTNCGANRSKATCSTSV